MRLSITETTMTDVRIHEVCLRDGLQNEPVVLSTARKIELVDQLVQAGCCDIEVTSFVRPRLLPQLADAAEVVAGLSAYPDVRYWALVPNAKGLERALDAGVGHVATVMSVSESHNKRNVNRTVRESLASISRVLSDAKTEGLGTRAYLSTVFGCPFEGEMSVERTRDLVLGMFEAGADVVALGDTVGMGTPADVMRVLDALEDAGVELSRLAMHFHDTRGMALTNVYASWLRGIRHFDGSVSGVGGCPYAPGAAGNAATEDLLYLLEKLGAETGIDLEQLCVLGESLEHDLGRELPGRYQRYWRGRGKGEAQSA
jgi:hydroxymethylglutaryl-CoA lyase